MSETTETKTCNFRGCLNEIPVKSEFPMCDTCRTIYVTERLTLSIDPFSSRAKVVRDKLTQDLMAAQSPAELLATREHLQELYLEYCKVIKLHGIEPKSPRVVKTLQEQIDDARSDETERGNAERLRKKTVAQERERLSKLQKQMKALGCKDPTGKKGSCVNCNHEKQAKRIFNDENGADDLGF